MAEPPPALSGRDASVHIRRADQSGGKREPVSAPWTCGHSRGALVTLWASGDGAELLGGLGALYNRSVVACLDLAEQFSPAPPELRAACIGAIVGLVLRLQSKLVGGGEALNQDVLTGSEPLLALAGLIALRSFLGPFSYAAGTPGRALRARLPRADAPNSPTDRHSASSVTGASSAVRWTINGNPRVAGRAQRPPLG
jgi:hypothetical protein